MTTPGSTVRKLMIDAVADGLRHRVQCVNGLKEGRGYSLSELDPLGAISGFTADLAKVLTNNLKYGTEPKTGERELKALEAYTVEDGTISFD